MKPVRFDLRRVPGALPTEHRRHCLSSDRKRNFHCKRISLLLFFFLQSCSSRWGQLVSLGKLNEFTFARDSVPESVTKARLLRRFHESP